MGYALTTSHHLGFGVGSVLPCPRCHQDGRRSRRHQGPGQQQRHFLWLGFPAQAPKGRRCRALVPRASSGPGRGAVVDGGGQKVYPAAQAQGTPLSLPVKQVVSYVLPVGTFVVISFGRNFGDEGLTFLAESLGYNQSAEEVDFSGNGITATGIKAFEGILQSNFVLKALNLSGNAIGDEAAKCLSDILAKNSGIQKLQLNSTGLGDEGAKAIAEILKKNSCLHVLELNNNMIDYSGFASLGSALLENTTIRSIHLNGNYGGALGASSLAKDIEGNKSPMELHVHGNDIGNEGIKALMSGLTARRGSCKDRRSFEGEPHYNYHRLGWQQYPCKWCC